VSGDRTVNARRLCAAMAALEWSNKVVARRFGVSSASVTYGMQGQNSVPEHVLVWLEERVAILAAQRPAPPWRG
jgi:Trp operon repressor